MAKFSIVDIRKIPSGEPSRIGKMDFVVTYKLDAFRTSMLVIAKNLITEADIVEAVRKEIESTEGLVGKELTT
jgi:hypothetical protein